MPEAQTPEWVKDAVFYQIFPDRFARSARVPKPSQLQPWGSPPTIHGYQGGDLLGVVERLDYLADLGVTAIYFNPIFRSAANHRYHTHDYYQVDPMLGGNAALRELLDAAHGRGIKVVLDGVFNHASRGFLQFNDILENGPESAYLDWFTVEDWPLRPYGSKQPNYHCWWGNPALPKFNTATPAVREFLWDVARHWIEFGVDGWRLDVPGEINDDEFWREFRRRVRAANPEAYIVGEIWDEADRWLQGDQFDAVMNYGVGRAALGFFASATFDRDYKPGGFRLHELGARHFIREIDRLMKRHPWPITQAQLNMLDSHDTARFLTQAGGDSSALRLAVQFLMTIPGAPCLYYGTEIGMAGGPDPDCRRAFPWDAAAWDRELLATVQRAIALRQARPALRRGQFERFYASDDVCTFGRRLPDDAAVVAFNASHEERSLSIDTGDLLPDGAATDAWSGATVRVSNGIVRHATLAPRSAAVFVTKR
ncbi:MAG: cyclomaltodextrinase / maltogenic alpha-amylase / neopullulanase [Chloroflexota bacterium]|nr:cyclomaltodextrinase / maltogenic alpha-amylase / neopullulanase [Chloroflexota bacterium]